MWSFFRKKSFSLKMILPPIKRTYCPLRSILAFVLVKTFPATEWSTISHQEIFIDSEKSYSIDESSADDDSPKNDESFSPTHRNHHSYSPKFTYSPNKISQKITYQRKNKKNRRNAILCGCTRSQNWNIFDLGWVSEKHKRIFKTVISKI